MIEDIKVVQQYGWRTTDQGERVWDMTSYKIMIKSAWNGTSGGEWSEVPVEHINPFPPEEKDHEDGERSS